MATQAERDSFGMVLETIERGELEDLLRAVVDDNADAILVVREDGTVVVANPAAASMLGRGLDELIGGPFGFPLTASESTELDLVHGGEPQIAEMRVNRSRLWGQPVYVATLRDVTPARSAQEVLRGFVSMASHEFQTPLASITTFAETMLDELDELDRDELRRYLEIVSRQGRRLRRLADDLLALTRLDADARPPRSRTLDLRAYLVDAVRSFGSEREVQVAVEEGLAARCDPDHLDQIVTNLLSNAMKYGSAPYRVDAVADGDSVVVRVTDGGPGVPPEFRPRLFERFSREAEAARRHEGTGLGLAIVAELARRNGGRAWYQDAPGAGAQFCFSLART